MPVSEAQKRANKNWRESHKEQWAILQKKHRDKWIDNNREHWNDYVRIRQYKLYHWRKIKLEFLQILLDWKHLGENWTIIIIYKQHK